MRRQLLPAVFLLVSLASSVVAARLGPEAVAATAAPIPPDTATPVLSPRRVPGLVAAPLGRARLQSELDAVSAAGPPGACLMVANGDDVLYEREPDLALIPASATKLVTAAAVLHHLDPGERLTTSVVAADGPDDGVVAGDLWLVGGGDPVLGTQAWAAHFKRQPVLVTPIEELARRLVEEAGVREIRGRVLGDDSRYDAVRYVPSWPARYRTDSEIGPLSALWVNDGLAAWEPDPVPFPDAAQGAAAVLTDLLRQRGVVVAGEPGAGRAPAGVPTLATLESPSVGDLTSQLLRESDNGTAELLLKEVGLRARGIGSTAAGAEAAMASLAERRLPTAGLEMVDGSGLDRGNRLSCRLLMAILGQAPDGGPIDSGLAVAGVSGTLWKRYVGTPVEGRLRAKTGSLLQVSALAGEVDGRDGTTLTFAYLLNGVDWSREGPRLQDRLADILARYPDVPALHELGPVPLD